MDASTSTTGFTPGGLSPDTENNVLSPVDPAFDFLDQPNTCAGVGPNAVPPWCLSNQAYAASPYVDEVPGGYLSIARPSFSEYQHPSWPAAGDATSVTRLSTSLGALHSGPEDALISPATLWIGESNPDYCEAEIFSPISDPGMRINHMIPSPLAIVESPSAQLKRSCSPPSLPHQQPGKATARPKTGRIGKQHNIQLRTAARRPRRSSTTNRAALPPSPPDSQATATTQPSPTAEAEDEDELTPEERRARRNHNLVEKQYRNRLNAQFERLLAVLPIDQYRHCNANVTENGRITSILDDKRMSKAEVLDLAVRRIRTLEADKERMQRDRREMARRLDLMTGAVQQQQQQHQQQQQVVPLGL
ncbi:hypothetical protein QBC42DRAFT_278043 [Cladorrhinum samala]|uniref:BHLH domain-containing protein n=1 Tax=Cladorrhinum samala TaxID=585594 RepID=A0AAV9HB69_9PEZI|nr:hypothetical protein QBC42DRAFT_278043 [Cladorrhinum samala]